MTQNRTKTDKKAKVRPTFTTEERQNRLTAMAMDLAEQRLLDGTASNQMICHFLKLGSEKERLDKVNLQEEINLKIAKREALEGAKHIEELYTNALKAMQSYSGQVSDDEDVY